jgi:hypothetical protein
VAVRSKRAAEQTEDSVVNKNGTTVLLLGGEGKERVEVASCVPRVGKPQRWDLRGPKIDLKWMLNEFVDEK